MSMPLRGWIKDITDVAAMSLALMDSASSALQRTSSLASIQMPGRLYGPVEMVPTSSGYNTIIFYTENGYFGVCVLNFILLNYFLEKKLLKQTFVVPCTSVLRK